jgi:hypothetical protein
VPRGWWDELSNQKAFMEKMQSDLSQIGVAPTAITTAFVNNHGGSKLLKRYKSLNKLLKAFPLQGKVSVFDGANTRGRKTQRLLMGAIQSIFYGEEVRYDYKHPDLSFPNKRIHIAQ